MDMKQCPNGHFYDESKNLTCPYCNGGNDIGVTRPLGNDGGFQATAPVGNFEAPAFPKTAPVGNAFGSGMQQGNAIPITVPLNSPETNKTVALNVNEDGIDPVRGWLVCVTGKKKGKDFRLHSEKNFIGRSKGNDVCIDFDDTISKESHAIITYDIRSNKFWVQSGDGKSNIYLNDNIVLIPVEIKSNDILAIGKTELMFIPFCNDQFKWD